MSNYFKGLVGQPAVKSKLSFYLDAFYKTSQAPFLLMAGAKGLGKTEFAKAFAKIFVTQRVTRGRFLRLIVRLSKIMNNSLSKFSFLLLWITKLQFCLMNAMPFLKI